MVKNPRTLDGAIAVNPPVALWQKVSASAIEQKLAQSLEERIKTLK
jgi:hypothetical protein